MKDVREIADLVSRAYVDLPPYTLGEIRGQLNNYRDGCFVARLDGVIVGYCASMRLKANVALSDHSWDEVTGNGFGSRHDPTGDWLYGYEMCVDPKVRGTRIGRRLYEERRALAERLDLSGIVFGGRMPGLANAMRRKRNNAESPQDYLEKVIDNKTVPSVPAEVLKDITAPLKNHAVRAIKLNHAGITLHILVTLTVILGSGGFGPMGG